MRTVDLAIVIAYLGGHHLVRGSISAGARRACATIFSADARRRGGPSRLSIVSAETSTLTIVSTPALAFAGNLEFLQLVLGYLLARIVISVLFLPHYFRGEMFTAYELMRRRFGERIRKMTASIFLVTRVLAEGVRVAAIAIVVSVVLGVGQTTAIVVIVALTLFYTLQGGMTAVIWTEFAQTVLYLTGAIVSFLMILHSIPGGWSHVAAMAGSAGKLAIFDFRFAPTMAFFARKYTFWAGLAGGCFLTTASHGTDQLMVQMLLSARNERQSRTALLSSWLVIFFQFTLFLLTGIALWAFYAGNGMAPPARLDRVYPLFIWNYLPPGISGLTIAAIMAAAMANLSASLNSLSSTTVIDFFHAGSSDRPAAGSLKLARLANVFWAVVMLPIAVRASSSQSVLEAGLTIASIPSGMLLGVFLLGVLTKKPRERAAMAGAAAGLCAILYVCLRTPIAFTWYVAIGTVVTFSAGMGGLAVRTAAGRAGGGSSGQGAGGPSAAFAAAPYYGGGGVAAWWELRKGLPPDTGMKLMADL